MTAIERMYDTGDSQELYHLRPAVRASAEADASCVSLSRLAGGWKMKAEQHCSCKNNLAREIAVFAA